MNIRQLGSDIVLLVKQDRKAQVLTAIFVVVLLWALFGESTPRRQVYVEQLQQPGTPASDPNEHYEDLITRVTVDLAEIKESTKQNAEDNKELKEDIAEFEERSADIFKKLIERISDIEQTRVTESSPVSAQNYDEEPIGEMPDDGLQGFGDIATAEVQVPEPPAPKKVAIIGAGDSVRVRLIAGVNAPTDGTPYPVLLEVMDDVAGPDGSALPLGGARIIAAAQGSLTDQRALFRLTKLNLRYPDGSRNVLDVDGWIVGEDGVRGMEGILVDPIGKAIGGAVLAGTVQGFGDGVAATNRQLRFNTDGSVSEFVNGDTTEFAAGRGLSAGGRAWSGFIRDRVDLLVPHVKVLSGREATAVFSQNVMIEGLYEALEEDEVVYASLD